MPDYTYTPPAGVDYAAALANMGTEGSLASRPNGAVEPVAILDDAIRQVKSYLLDDQSGPKAYCDALQAAVDVLEAEVVRRQDFNENSILVSEADDSPLPLEIAENAVLTRNSAGFKSLSVLANSLLARADGDLIALQNAADFFGVFKSAGTLQAIPIPVNESVMVRSEDEVKPVQMPDAHVLGRQNGDPLAPVPIADIRAGLEPTITPSGDVNQYYAGNKTFRDLPLQLDGTTIVAYTKTTGFSGPTASLADEFKSSNGSPILPSGIWTLVEWTLGSIDGGGEDDNQFYATLPVVTTVSGGYNLGGRSVTSSGVTGSLWGFCIKISD